MRPAFSFQVTSKGVIINLDPDLDFEKLQKSLIEHVNNSSEFFAGVDMYLNMNDRRLEFTQLQEIMGILKRYNKVENIYFINENKIKSDPDITYNKDTVLIKRTIRSGQRIKYPTNIVIMGDINPGAVVIAGGDIVVLGKLKGVVHAGADGSTVAEVVALKLQPTQLRIGSIISRPPEDDIGGSIFYPERAYVKDGAIIVDEFTI
jgi:septum site-determining protein MinC